ncbi:MAG: hypothetical protein ABIV94_07945 [Acidimicrobiales bacterium]
MIASAVGDRQMFPQHTKHTRTGSITTRSNVAIAELGATQYGVVMNDREGFIGEVDFVFDPWVIVEVDGATHRGPLDIAHDRQRDDPLRRLNFVERVPYRPDLVLHPERVARRVLELIESMN